MNDERKAMTCAGLIMCAMLSIGVFAANEINTMIGFTVNKGSLNVARSVNLNFTLTNAAPNVAGGTQLITTTPSIITTGNVATNGWSFFRNLDASNYVELGYSDTTNFQAIIRMNAGEPALFRLAQGAVLYGRANVTNVTVEKQIIDN
jgi:hypothetical protein